MPVYLVTYDVNSPNEHLREFLRKQIREVMKGVKISESCYALYYSSDANSLYQYLLHFVDQNDYLGVFRLQGDLAGNGPDDAVNWFDSARIQHLF